MAVPQPYLVIGGTGLLGEALLGELRRRDQRFLAPPRAQLNLLDPLALDEAVETIRPRAVLNASAFSDVVRAELPECRAEVFKLNRELPGRLALTCRRLEIPLVHVSTDYVFDGTKGRPYVETDAVHPLQVYGQSKLEGEIVARHAHAGTLIVRTSTVYGPGRRQRPHYVDAILAQARQAGRLEVVRLPVSSPTYAPDLAVAMLELLSRGVAGIVHVTNRGSCSRLELARTAVKIAGRPGVEVLERPAPAGGLCRPEYSVLDTSCYTTLTGTPMRDWPDALEHYLRQVPG